MTVEVNGHRLAVEDVALLGRAAVAACVPDWKRRVLQGSYSTGVEASGGTHDGGGVVDLDTGGLSPARALEWVAALRGAGYAAWWRTRAYGWAGVPHIHAVRVRCADLAPAAVRQVEAYRAGRNGLADGGRDPHPRPVVDAHYPGRPVGPGSGDTAAVMTLQRHLGLTVDGVFGPKTAAAVREYIRKRPRLQNARPPYVDAVVGPVTWRSIVGHG